MNLKHATLRIALVLLAFPASASGQGRALEERPFTNITPASYLYADSLLRSASDSTDAWWQEISGRTPPDLDLYVYDRDDAASAYAEQGAGRVYVTRQFRDISWATANNRALLLSERRGALIRLWGVIAHERGHNLGVAHEGCPTSIMCGTVTHTPWQAAAWARAVLPTPAKKPARRVDRRRRNR